MQTRTANNLFNRNIALPQDHGSWVFLLSPLLIGLFAAPNWSLATLLLIIASLTGFLIRQPITHLVKIYSKRRPKTDTQTSVFWVVLYSSIGFICVLGLVYLGFSYIMLLALPGVAVFTWYLILVTRRNERKQGGVEIVASGVLALSAPAAYWVGAGKPDPTGLVLFFLVWLQSAASIVYAYVRLEQRHLNEIPEVADRFKLGKRALLYSSFNLFSVLFFSIIGMLPTLLPIPYLIQWIEVIWGTYHPAVQAKPAQIGLRQLVVSTIFTISFIITWNI